MSHVPELTSRTVDADMRSTPSSSTLSWIWPAYPDGIGPGTRGMPPGTVDDAEDPQAVTIDASTTKAQSMVARARIGCPLTCRA
jgi:hypothetical protein